MVYKCPLCKKEYKRYSWFVKHIYTYSDEQKKIFYSEDGEVITQSGLNKFLKKN